jgi:GPH family glycoside/pentoside/hexuronide:cation symporter
MTASTAVEIPGIAAASPAPVPRASALQWWEKVGYSLGDTASNFYWKTFEVFIFFYYTDVFGLPAAQIATMLLVTRTWDAVADPLMGVIADRTNTRFGKFRPYLLWCAVPMAITGVLTFTRPALTGMGLVAYAYVTYTSMMIAYTAINIPYSALLGVMTATSAERTSASSYRFVAAFCGGLLVQSFTPSLVKILGGADAATGWQRVMVLYGVASAGLFVVSFLTTRERISPPADQHADLKRDVVALLGNRPWWVLFGLGMFVIVSFWLRGGAAMYYFRYYCHRADLVGWYFFSGTVASIGGAALAPQVTRLFGKRNAYAILMVTGSVLTVAMYFVPPSGFAAIFGINIAVAFILGPQAPIVWAMYADTADYSEWKSGRRTTGLVFAAAVFSMKIGGAVGGWALGTMLDRFGYVANAEQTPAALHGILLAISVVPGVFALLAVGIVMLYELDERKVAVIERELAARREAVAV